jgi:arylsulfatase A-like enzyme
MIDKPNLIVVIADTFRKDHLGCYGHPTILTPNLDNFASESTVFMNAYPESLPTIPVRRALHTGRRAYPFHNYRPVKWDIVYLPGWQPMDNDEDTVAENLAAAGYHTGFVTDTLPYFTPGFNFTRGFWQWEFVRGEQQDRWKSPFVVSSEELKPYGDPTKLGQENRLKSITYRHIANTNWVKSKDETLTARVFQWAIDFLADNKSGQPFYLLVDCFKPHEPWEAPLPYYQMYADSTYKGKTILHTHYGAIGDKYTPEEVKNIQAHYCGLCTEIDDWFGKFIQKLKALSLWDNSLVIFTSDHGTNFGDNPDHIIGKPSQFLYPGTMDLPLIVHFPKNDANQYIGQRVNEFVYNLDVTATLYDHAGIDLDHHKIQIDGQSLRLACDNNMECGWRQREYVTSRYGSSLWYRDHHVWMILTLSGIPTHVFYLEQDPQCTRNEFYDVDETLVDMVWARLLADAGGKISDYTGFNKTDAIGQ